jgi:hypothetical protein
LGLGRNGVLGAQFDGNKKHFLNITLGSSESSSTGLNGLWNTISSTGLISKLNLTQVHRTYINSGGSIIITTPAQYNAGLLASVNQGVIEDIRITDSSLMVNQIRFDSVTSGVDADFEVNVGGLVGKNLGTIQRTDGSPHIEFFNPSTAACSSADPIELYCPLNNLHHWDNTKIGGVAGLNEGIISKTRNWMHMHLNRENSHDSFNLGSNDYLSIGAIAGENKSTTANNGIIKESSADFSIQLSQPNSSSNGNYYLGGAVGKNGGQLENVQANTEVNFNLYAPFSGNGAIGGLIGKNIASGILTKSMAQMFPTFITMSGITVGGLIGKNYYSSALPSDSNLCLYSFESTDPEKLEFAAGGGGAISNTARCVDMDWMVIQTEQDTILITDNQDYSGSTFNLVGWSWINDFYDFSSTAIWLVDPENKNIELRGDVGLPEN